MAETDLWRGDTRDQFTSVAVLVTNCRFTLDTVSRWSVPGEANIQATARIDHLVLEPDEDGTYHANAPVTWSFSASRVLDCIGTITADPMIAKVFATIDGSGQLDVEVTFDPVNESIAVDCGIAGRMQQQQQPEPVVFTVSTKGGSRVQSQGLSGQPGKVKWWVAPIGVE